MCKYLKVFRRLIQLNRFANQRRNLDSSIINALNHFFKFFTTLQLYK